MSLLLSRDQVRRIDELAMIRYGLPGIVLMENAGRGAAEVIERVYGPRGRAFFVCGAGNNGGDGFVIARHLHNFGWSVRILLVGDVSKLTPDTATNHRAARAMGMPITCAVGIEDQIAALPGVGRDDVLVDALLGTGFRGPPRAPLIKLISALNASMKRAVVAVDVPSGWDGEPGALKGASIRADLTITFVARKSGFDLPRAEADLGSVEVVDIGVPAQLIRDVAAGKDV